MKILRRFSNALGVIIIIGMLHGCAHDFAESAAATAGIHREMAEMSQLLGKKNVPADTIAAASEKTDVLLFITSLPLGPFLDDGREKKFDPYDAFGGFSIMELINSFAFGMICYLFLWFAVYALPFSADSRARRFIRGETIKTSSAFKHALLDLPGLKFAYRMKRAEKKKFGPVLIITVFHAMISGVVNIFAAAENMGGSSTYGLGSKLQLVMQLPFSPFFIPARYWNNSIVVLCNSACAAILLIALWNCFKWFRSKASQESVEEAES